jgi:hypothetical protein
MPYNRARSARHRQSLDLHVMQLPDTDTEVSAADYSGQRRGNRGKVNIQLRLVEIPTTLMGYSRWTLVQYAAGIRLRVTMIYLLIKPMVGTDGYGSQAQWLPQNKSECWVPARATSIGADKGVLALKSVPALCIQFHRQVEFQSRRAVGISRRPRFSTIERTISIPIPIPFDLVVKKASKSRGMTSGSMPFPEPNRDQDAPRCPTARCSLPLLESPCFSTLIMRAYRRPEFRTNRQCIASPPPLAYFCDVCAAQILSELKLSNNLAARSPNSMISRNLNDRCSNCSITTLTCYNAATQPIA